MKARRIRIHILIAGLLPMLIQLSQYIDIAIPVIIKSSICTISVAVLSTILSVWGRFD